MIASRLIMTVLLLIFSMDLLWAEYERDEKFKWHGFLTQGYIKTSDNKFFGDSENGSFEFTEAAFNGSYRVSENILFAGQLLSRNAGSIYDATPASVDFALLDYLLPNVESGKAGLRVGRIKNLLGLYNETRDVAFTRPGILVPQVIYFDKVRNLVLATDGMMFYRDLFTESGNFSFTVGGGRPLLDTNVEIAYLFEDRPGKFEPDGLTALMSGFYSTMDDRLKLGLSGATGSLSYNPATGEALLSGETEFQYWIVSFQYNLEKWSISAEFMREPIQWKHYGPFFPDSKATAEGYYVQSAFRFKPELEFMLRYEEGFANKDDRSGQQLYTATGGTIPGFSRYSKIMTTSIRWDISPALMLRAEMQWHEGTFVLSRRENTNLSDLNKDWTQFSVLASYRF